MMACFTAIDTSLVYILRDNSNVNSRIKRNSRWSLCTMSEFENYIQKGFESYILQIINVNKPELKYR